MWRNFTSSAIPVRVYDFLLSSLYYASFPSLFCVVDFGIVVVIILYFLLFSVREFFVTGNLRVLLKAVFYVMVT